MASKYFYNCISTDDIGQVIQTVIDIDPMKGHDYREYYTWKSIDDFIEDIIESNFLNVNYIIELAF